MGALAAYWADHLAEFCIAQHEAGAAAVQVFDSWAGSLALEDYRDSVLPWSRRLIERVRAAGVPVIHLLRREFGSCWKRSRRPAGTRFRSTGACRSMKHGGESGTTGRFRGTWIPSLSWPAPR